MNAKRVPSDSCAPRWQPLDVRSSRTWFSMWRRRLPAVQQGQPDPARPGGPGGPGGPDGPGGPGWHAAMTMAARVSASTRPDRHIVNPQNERAADFRNVDLMAVPPLCFVGEYPRFALFSNRWLTIDERQAPATGNSGSRSSLTSCLT